VSLKFDASELRHSAVVIVTEPVRSKPEEKKGFISKTVCPSFNLSEWEGVFLKGRLGKTSILGFRKFRVKKYATTFHRTSFPPSGNQPFFINLKLIVPATIPSVDIMSWLVNCESYYGTWQCPPWLFGSLSFGLLMFDRMLRRRKKQQAREFYFGWIKFEAMQKFSMSPGMQKKLSLMAKWKRRKIDWNLKTDKFVWLKTWNIARSKSVRVRKRRVSVWVIDKECVW
jgi:hypothetical protein